MKRVIAFLLALVMCLSLCACGGNSNTTGSNAESTHTPTPTDNSISLTTSNYLQYLELNGNYGVGGHSTKFSGYSFYFYDAIDCNFEIVGASPNFNYNNVTVTVQITGTYSDYSSGRKVGTKSISEIVVIPCNIGGTASKTISVDVDHYTYQKSIELSMNVVEVSGTVTPVS